MQSLVSGHLSCFRVSATVHNAVTNEYLFKTLLSMLLGTYPEVELRGHVVILLLRELHLRLEKAAKALLG